MLEATSVLLITQLGVCEVTVQDCKLLVSGWNLSSEWTHYICYSRYLWHTILSVQVSVYLGWEHTIKAWSWRIKCSPDNNKHRHSTVGLQPHVTLYPVSTIFMPPSLHAVWTHQRTLGKKECQWSGNAFRGLLSLEWYRTVWPLPLGSVDLGLICVQDYQLLVVKRSLVVVQLCCWFVRSLMCCCYCMIVCF